MNWFQEGLRLKIFNLQSERLGRDQYEKSQTKQYGKHWTSTLSNNSNRLQIAWLDFKIEFWKLLQIKP